MERHLRRGRKWREFSHKVGAPIFLGLLMIATLAAVSCLMYALTSMSCRVRY